MDQIIRLATFTDFGDCKREDINDLIASLVRIGYEVSLVDDYVCFKLGYDDNIKEIKE